MTAPPGAAPVTAEVADLLDIRYETARAIAWCAVMFEKMGRSPAEVGVALTLLLEQVAPPDARQQGDDALRH